VSTTGRQRLDGTFKGIKRVFFSVEANDEGSIVHVSTNFALHGIAPSRDNRLQTLRRVRRTDTGTPFAAPLPPVKCQRTSGLPLDSMMSRNSAEEFIAGLLDSGVEYVFGLLIHLLNGQRDAKVGAAPSLAPTGATYHDLLGIAQDLARGGPNGGRIALTLFRNKVEELFPPPRKAALL
jgi:hypothetical protein